MTSSEKFRDLIGSTTTPDQHSGSDDSKLSLTEGLLFEYEHCLYRIIGIDRKEGIVFFAVATGNTLFVSAEELVVVWRYYYAGTIKPIKEEAVPIQYELLSEAEKEDFEKKKEAMMIVRQKYGPDYRQLIARSKKPDLIELADKCGMEYNYFRRMVTKYLLSGFKDSVLLSKRSAAFGKKVRGPYNHKVKAGRPETYNLNCGVVLTDEVRSQFEVSRMIYLSSKDVTLADVYDDFLTIFYPKDGEQTFDNNTKPIDQVPTQRQMEYYIRTHTTKYEKSVKKLGSSEVANNYRPLESESKAHAMGPGDIVSIDACEVDLTLVHGKDRHRLLGRPILYTMIDVYSKLIVAVSLSFENNSYIGLTGLFLNLADTIPGFAEKNGLELNGAIDAWVSNVLPNSAYMDRGAEFMSEGFAKVTKRLDIMKEPNPPRRGSSKGDVERYFEEVHATQAATLDHHGRITKDYDSDHKEKAVMDIKEYSQLVAVAVTAHNRRRRTNTLWNEEYVDNTIEVSPKGIWDYCTNVKKYAPRKIVNLEQYYYDLMISSEATITRKGLVFQGLTYSCKEDKGLKMEMFEANPKVSRKKGAKKKIIRYDPRDTTYIYYERDGKICHATIDTPDREADSSYAHMSWAKYFSFRHVEKTRKKLDKHTNVNINCAQKGFQRQVVENAESKKTFKNDTKNIRQNREEAKEEFRQEDNIAKRMGLSEPEAGESTEPVKQIPEKMENAAHNENPDKLVTDLDEMEFGGKKLWR